ncbi:MAG: helix-turn-helix domain-containing protein [Lachnospiraceae bacterium]|nr:helix-turn-helix domain-containing protein [Lachnospiraceae bacterium]
MSVANKMRAILNLTNHKIPDLAECLNMSNQGVRNKFSRDSFSVADLIKICDVLNCELSIKTRDGQIVYLCMDDLKQEPNNNANQEEN